MIATRSILISFLLLIVSGCELSETREASYADYSAAEKAGEVKRGWIPAYIPKSAVNIRLKYDIENNQTWLTFHVSGDDLLWIQSSCERVSGSEMDYPRKSPARWWPSGLINNVSQQQGGFYEYYRCQNKGMVAFDKNRKEFFYWSLG